MLDLSTAVLCDFAQVRDRLLFVSSGAVSRLYRQELPSPLGLMVGLVIEVPLEDAGMEHQLRAEVINRHGTVLATLENTFRVSDTGLFPHEVQQVPLVLSITGVRARTWGTHQVRLYLDNDLVRALTLYVVPAAAPQQQVRATQSREDDTEGTMGGTGTDGVTDVPGAPTDPEPQPADADETVDAGSVTVLRDDPLQDLDAPIVLDDPYATPAPAPAPAPAFAPEPEPQYAPPPPAPAPAPAFAPEPQHATPPPPAPQQPAPPQPHEAIGWADPVPAPVGSPPPPPAPRPQAPPPTGPARVPTIDAPQAGAPVAPAPRVFDFEDPETEDAPEPEASRFSFRYLVDDE